MLNNSIANLEEELSKCKKSTIEHVDILHQLIVSYLNTDLQKAKAFIDEAETISIELNYAEGIGLSNHQLGVYYYNLKDFDNALKYYLNADLILSKSKNWKNRIKPKTNIAMVYMHTQQYVEALRIYKEVEAEIQDIPLDIIHAQMYINIDAAYHFLNDPENGIIYTKKALSISEKLGSRYGIAISQSNFAGHLLLLNKPKEALQHLYISQEICETDVFKVPQIGNFFKLTDCYLRLNEFDKSLDFAEKGILLAKEFHDTEKEMFILKLVMDVYEKQQDFENAYQTSKKYVAVKEKMLNNEKIKSFNTLQLKYETEKKEAALNQLKLLQTQSELTALKSQMNPHFIFNALNSIQELYMVGDKNMANEQMGNFAQLTRKILDVSGKQSIYLSEEIEILTKYLELECMRFESDFSYNIHLSEEIDEDYVKLPPMLIQPYIENSMKHGLLHKNGKKQIDISFEINEEETVLTCYVEDNGIGRMASLEINKNKPQSHVSFSTSATEKRLQLLNQGKEENIAVVFEDKLDENNISLGTKVIIQIPI